ncbi:hypothetical protein [Methylococcus mesophilus]|uniref:hypothetical protein n=1 Tax=Methylococcus mesophilus TaxID=2993564 RepID=UPI00224B6194|nr:hypothetical protein [Methylococcus mesophilus]UZR30211.1 hypothetical protein OOT43_06095 [Methylococcus mesophilus]
MKQAAGATYEFVQGAWEKVGDLAQSHGGKALAAGAGTLAVSGNAFAGMGADAAAALTSAQTEGITAGTGVVAMVAALVVVGVVIALIKKA